MPSKVNISVLDYGSERSNMSFNVETIDGDSFDDVVGTGGVIETFQAALDGVILGTISKKVVNAQDLQISSSAPTSAFAQRESKWLVQYSDDTTGKLYSMEIPTADLALLQAGTEFMNTASGAGATFLAAFESTVRSPDTGENVTVQSVRYVSRDL